MAITLAVLYIIAGIAVAAAVLKRPEIFWEVFVIVLIATSGLKMLGQVIVDEYTIGLLVVALGILLWKKKIALAQPDRGRLARLHHTLFFLLIGYLLLQAFRGMIVLEDPRMVRWIGTFVLLGALGYLLPRLPFPKPSPERVSFLIVLTSSLYFLVYMASGIVAEFVRGISRYDLQHLEWAGTAGAVIPVLFALPAIFLLWEKTTAPKQRAWLLGSYAVAIIMSFYYDSRAVWFVILGFALLVILFGTVARKKSIFVAGAVFFLTFALMFEAQVPLGQTNLGFERFLPIRTERIASFSPQKEKKQDEQKQDAIEQKADKPQIAIPSAASVEGNKNRILIAEATYRAALGASAEQEKGKTEESQEQEKEKEKEKVAAKPLKNFDPSILLWGRGWYVARVTLAEYLVPLHEKYELPVNFVYEGNKAQPTGFAALLIDTGLVGMLLILATGAVTLLSLFQKASVYGLYATMLFAGILGTMFLWLFVANITPFLLLYLVIAPGSILFLMRPQDNV